MATVVQSQSFLSKLSAAVLAALLMQGANVLAASIELFGTRHDAAFSTTGPISGIFPASIGAPFPELTTVTALNDGTFTWSGPNGNSIFGTFQGDTSVPGPNNTVLFSGHVTYTGGTGQYAGVTGNDVFAGVNTFTSPTGGVQTVTDRGFINAPNISSPSSGSNDTSDGNSSGPFFNDSSNFDLSGSRQDVFFSNAGFVHSFFPTNITQPFPLNVVEIFNNGTADALGPAGNFFTNQFFTGSSFNGPFGPIFSGLVFFTGGSGGGLTVTGGVDVFVGKQQFDSLISGRESVTDYGFLTAVPEPATALLQLCGLLTMAGLLAVRRIRHR